MNNESGPGWLVGFCVLMVVVCLVFGIREGREQGRCKERWQHQHIPAESLATIRSGCPIPTPEQP